MYELIQAGPRTHYINAPSKMGLFVVEGEAVLIDSGNDKEAGKRVHKLLGQQQWRLTAIFNTHSNADHIGGNKLLQERTGCRVYAHGVESAFVNWPQLEPAFLYGGFAPTPLHNKFLQAPPSEALPLTDEVMPEGLTYFSLPGHFFDMVGFRTGDGVVFLADCLFGLPTLEKYHIPFLYDVAAYLETLELISSMQADLFVPAHAEPTSDIRPLALVNRAKVMEIAELLRGLCTQPTPFEELLRQVLNHYMLALDWSQYVLVGSTLRSFLAFLLDGGALAARFEDNRLLWQAL